MLVAGVCLALLLGMFLVELGSPGQFPKGAFGVIALLAAGFVLSRKLVVAVVAAAVVLELVDLAMGRVALATATEQTTAYLVAAGLAWLAADSMRTARNNAEQADRARKVVQTGIDLARASSSPGDWVGKLNQFSIETVDADGGHVSRLEGDELVVQASYDRTEPLLAIGNRWKITDQPLMAEVLASKRPVQGVPVVPAGVSPEIASIARRIRHYVVIPLVYGDSVHGIIALVRFREPAFPDAAIESVEQVASMASLALRASDLYDDLDTARLAAEATTSRLEKRERQLQDAQRMANLSNYEFDLERNQSSWSPETYRILGRDPSGEPLSLSGFLAMVHPDDRDKVRNALEQARMGKAGAVEYRITRPDGEQRTLVSHSRLIRDDANRPVTLAGTVQDITELKSAEEQLSRLTQEREKELRNHAQRMEALERVKTEFLLLASHELRGPLGVVNGYLSLMEAGALGDLPEKALSVLPIMSAQGGVMKRLIDEMLETARLEQTAELDLEPLDLRDAVVETIRMTARLGDAEDRVKVEVPAQAVPVIADHHRLTMIISALVDNALKYSAPRRAVTCRVGVEGGSAVVAVRDRGQGIRAEDLPRLFTRFGRIMSPENASVPGTGLGLYLAQQFAHMQGGRITVESEPGQGSTFALRLPVATDLRFASDDGSRGLTNAGQESLTA
jgi:PAS domain S-box-containing protein